MNAPAISTKADRLYWIKYNPNEWQGMYGELTDEEYGLLHRIIARLWATPGNRLTPEDLLTGLRVLPNSRRARLVAGLIGYALKLDADGFLFVTAVDDAFADAIKRGKAGAAGANARWDKTNGASPKAVPQSTSVAVKSCPTSNPTDF